jgi:glycosyltransferase involved in cell wall biosynthesis
MLPAMTIGILDATPAIGELASEASLQLSIVVPMYNEVECVAPLIARLREVLAAYGRSHEIILVDDGSGDGTTQAILAAEQADERVRGVFLARNYGQSTAMQAGFDVARGDVVVTMDGDLQNDPADIPRLIRLLEERDVDVVSGWRQDRQDEPLRKLFSRLANRLISRMTGVKLNDYGCSLKVYRRELLVRTRLYGELHRFLPALLSEVGAEIVEVPVVHHPRRFGSSKYGLDRTMRVVLDLLLVMFFRRYIQRPLHIFGGAGLICIVPGGLILIYLTLLKLLAGASIGGRPLLSLGVLLVVVGVVLIGQGLLGELTGRLLHEAGGRAQYHLKSPRKLHNEAPPTAAET